MRTVRFGIIGCGLMGKEFASAAARWCHLTEMGIKPEITAICDANEQIMEWYTQNFSTIKQVTKNYKELLSNQDVEAVYIAVPHNLHTEIYCAVIEAGKHFLGEKPFGIDKAANDKIIATIKKHPKVFVRCSSEFPFFPASQQIGKMIEDSVFGNIIEVNAGLLHSSDLDSDKPINWKRLIKFNGQYGCMGDLGLHVCHVPFRAGWFPKNVRAILSNIVKQRPDGKGGIVACETWDNATLMCESIDPYSDEIFPLTMKTQRISPGQTNTWYLEILGTKTSVKFSTANPKCLEVLEYSSKKKQAWQKIGLGQETAFKNITGSIFEFGFSDAILQMWAAYLYELNNGKPLNKFAGCVTPGETMLSHKLFTAALESQETGKTINLTTE
jgi:predicted dehydrogenase